MQNNALAHAPFIPGSLLDVSAKNGTSLAESFISADAIIMVDVSGSMHDHLAEGTRYDKACSELKRLQADLPGKIAVVAFSSHVEFLPAGFPVFQGGMTRMAECLNFCHVADAIKGMRFIMVSDGCPDNAESALAAAKKYQNKIDCIFIGPEDDYAGRGFLDRLASATGGKSQLRANANLLAEKIETLLLASGA